MVDKLYDKSGLSHEKAPAYEFDFVAPPPTDSKVRAGLMAAFSKMKNLPQAASMSVGKTAIVISTPLLQLLDDGEEYAVLGHEFAHAAAKHRHIKVIPTIMNGTSVLASMYKAGKELILSGFLGIGAAIATEKAVRYLFSKWHRDGRLLDLDDDDLMLKLRLRKQNLKAQIRPVARVSQIGVLSSIAPSVVPVYVGYKAISFMSEWVKGALSRTAEYQADRGAVELGASPLDLVTALRKIDIIYKRSSEKLGIESRQNRLQKAWNKVKATHPPINKRVNALCQIARENGFNDVAIQKAAQGYLDVPSVHDIPPDVLEGIMARIHPTVTGQSLNA